LSTIPADKKAKIATSNSVLTSSAEVKASASSKAESSTFDVSKYCKNNLNDSFSRLRGYVSNTTFRRQVDDRKSHQLVKNTIASFGRPGEDIVNIARGLGIKVTEDLGDSIDVNIPLISCFKSNSLITEHIKENALLSEAARQMASLAYNLSTYSELPNFYHENDLGIVFVRFWFIKHIQKVFFDSNPGDYSAVSRIPTSRQNELASKLLPFANVVAVNLFLDLIEKIVNMIVLNIKNKADTDAKNFFLGHHRTHFFSMKKTFEKVLPKSQKVKLTEAARVRLARNPRYKVKDTDKSSTLVTVRPTLDTEAYLDEKEKVRLKDFNRKLNEVSAAVPEISTADGSARKACAISLQKALFTRVASINHILAKRRNQVHAILVHDRESSADPIEKEKSEKKIPFTPSQWVKAFERLDKSDLSTALMEQFSVVDPALLKLDKLVSSLMNESASSSSKSVSSPFQREDSEDNDMI